MTKKQVSPERQFGARIALALQKQAVSDETLGFKSTPAPKPTLPKPAPPPLSTASVTAPRRPFDDNYVPPRPPTPAANPAVTSMPPAQGEPTMWQNMRANAGRTSYGILGSLAGGLGNVVTGIPAGGTNMWNAVTPQSWNTPDAWTRGVNDVFDKSVNFTNESAKSVFGGLGGDADYHNDRTQATLEQGWNDPNVDAATRAWAQRSAAGGKGAWNFAQTVAGGNAVAGGLKLLPGVDTAAKLYPAVPEPLKRTVSYVSGVPLTNTVNQTGMMASILGQNAVDGMLRQYDQRSIADGVDSNLQQLLPMNALQSGVRNLVGDEAGDAVNSLLTRRFMGPVAGVASAGGLPMVNATSAQPQPDVPQTGNPDQSRDVKPLVGPDAAPASGPEPAEPTQTVAAPEPAQPAPAAAVQTSMETAAQPGAPPEVKQQAQTDFQSFMKQQIDSNPKFAAGAADLMAQRDTPAAQEFRTHLESVGNDVMDAELKRLYAANPNPTPEQAGGFMAQAADSWNKLGPAGQTMVALGGGLGMVGLAMSLFGGEEGGLLPMLMALLGLGAAGLGAAGGGMFGQQGQDFAGNLIGGLGQMTGMIPQSLTPDQKAILTSKDPIQTVLAQGGGMLTREQAAQKVQEARAQMQQLQRLQGLGGMQNSVLQRMGLTPEEAQQAAQNIGALTADYADPNGRINKMLQSGEWYADPNQSGLLGGAYDAVSGAINSLRGKQGSADIGVALRIYKQRVASLC